MQHLEHMSDTHGLNFIFKQFLGRLDQSALHFADADRPGARHHQALFDEQLSKKVRLTRSPTTMRSTISVRLKKWTKDVGRLNAQAGQGSPDQFHE